MRTVLYLFVTAVLVQSSRADTASLTIATLPSPDSDVNAVLWIKDGATPGDCQTGNGTYAVPCQSSGTAWVSVSDANISPPAATTAPASGAPVFNVKTLGVAGDGKTVDTTAIQNAAYNHPGSILYFPAGDYLLDNNWAPGLTLTGFTGELQFEAGAHLLCNTPTTRGGWCVNIQAANNLVIDQMWVGFTDESGLPLDRDFATNGAVQVWNSSQVQMYSPHIDASQGLGLIAGASTGVSIYNASVQQTTADGCSFVNVASAYLDGLSAMNTGDDGLSIINYSFYRTTNTGFVGKNIQSFGSKARGISVPGQSNVSISNFYVSGSTYDGVLVLTDGSFSTSRPSNVNISNGVVAWAGTNGVEISGADNVSLSNIQSYGTFYSGFLTSTSTNNNITGSGLSASDTTGGGAGFFFTYLNGGTFSNLSSAYTQYHGLYFTGSANVTVTGVSITDAATARDSLHRALWMERNAGPITATNVDIIDDQLTPTGFIIGEYGNRAGPINVSEISATILNGSLITTVTDSNAHFSTVY